MTQTTVGGNKKKIMNALSITGLVVIFVAYMFPFAMVVINSLKQKRDIIKSPLHCRHLRGSVWRSPGQGQVHVVHHKGPGKG